MVELNSKAIQEAVYEFCMKNGFTAPYGVLTGEHVSQTGKKYKSVTFGRARSLDATVMIFNRSYMIVKTSCHGDRTFRTFDDLMAFLKTL